MITIPALKLRQFKMEFYQATLSRRDVAKLVEFVVLDHVKRKRRKKKKGKIDINWELLETLVKKGDTAYQRPIIKKKIEGLADYFLECSDEDKIPLPSIPGSVILVSREKLSFTPSGSNPNLGLLQIPEEEGVLHALDGQHRLVALRTADLRISDDRDIQVPAVIFDALTPAQEVEMFATINCTQTKLNPSLIVNLSGRRLYQNPKEVLSHEIARKLNETEGSPLHGEIKMLGVGPGKVQQATITRSLMEFFDARPDMLRREDEVKRFFLNYFKQLYHLFREAWEGRKYAIKSSTAVRGFIAAAPSIMEELKKRGEEMGDAIAIRRVLEPWGRRITSQRFVKEGEWKRKLASSSKRSAELLARELREALHFE